MKEEKYIVDGGVADNTADSGNPIKVGGKYNAAAPALTDGDRSDFQVTRLGFTKTLDYKFANPVTKIPAAFNGGTLNARGDFDGTGNPVTLFTVTGDVIVRLLAVCTTTLTIDATATLSVGIAGDTAKLIALTAGDAIDVGEIWHDATPDAKIELSSVLVENIIANGSNIIETTGTANITAGVIKYICFWYPLSADGLVVAAA